MPARKMRSVKRPKAYESMRKSGLSKSSAARIANKGRTAKGRSQMAKKAAKTRKQRGS
jgi:hypothetical protein